MEDSLSHSTGCLERKNRGCESTSAVTPTFPQTEGGPRNMPERVCDAPPRVSSFFIEDLLRSSKSDGKKTATESKSFCKDRNIDDHESVQCYQGQGQEQNPGLRFTEDSHTSEWAGSPNGELTYSKSKCMNSYKCIFHDDTSIQCKFKLIQRIC